MAEPCPNCGSRWRCAPDEVTWSDRPVTRCAGCGRPDHFKPLAAVAASAGEEGSE